MQKKKAHNPDYVLILIVAALIVFGLFSLSTASVVISQEYFGHSYFYLKHQILYGILPGLALLFITSFVYYDRWKKLSLFGFVGSIFLLLLTFAPELSYAHGGASRWLSAGGLSFQPAELVKLTTIIYLAALLDKKDSIHFRNIIPFLICLCVLGVVFVLQPDFSNLFIITLVSLGLLFVGGIKLKYFLSLILIAFVILGSLIFLADYRVERLTTFMSPNQDPLGQGWQTNQALIAIGSGGLTGQGLGHSIQKHLYLPEVIGDSIFAIIAEEGGFITVFTLIAFFLALALRGLNIARKAPDRFGCLVASGIIFLILIQATLNIGALSKIAPLTGTTLPLISYGGSSLIFLMAGLGLLINISRYSSRS